MKTLSIIIPVFNEAATVRELVSAVLKVKLPRVRKELVIIDDASQDKTLSILKSMSKRQTTSPSQIKLLRHTYNLGKGASVKQGLLHCTGDIVILQDADLEYDPQDYPRLIAPILNNQADVVYGSRFLGGDEHRVLFFWHSTMNFCLTLFSNMITNLNLTDMACCSKAFRGDLIRDLAPRLSSPRFGLESEITARLAKIPKIRIYEVKISYIGRSYSEGKHIRWWDGIKAIGQIIYYNWFSS